MLKILEKLIPIGKGRKTAIRWMWFIGMLCVCYLTAFLILSFASAYDREDWGQLGDTIGGILNPFFALLQLGILGYIAILVSQAEREKADEHIKLEIKAQHNILLSQLRYNHYNDLMACVRTYEDSVVIPAHSYFLNGMHHLRNLMDTTSFIFDWEKQDDNFKTMLFIESIILNTEDEGFKRNNVFKKQIS